MTILSIDGHEYSTLPITKLRYSVEILDGPGTGRMDAPDWPMFREPQGRIKNIDGEIWLLDTPSTDSELQRLLRTLDSFGTRDFAPVSFITPSGTVTQDMYAASYSIELRRVQKDGKSYWGVLPFKLVAKKGVEG